MKESSTLPVSRGLNNRVAYKVWVSALIIGTAIGCLADPLQADTTESTWLDSGTNWNTSGNWGNGLPSATISAVFDTTTGYTNQPTLTAAGTSQGIWVTGASGGVTTTISGTFGLTITGNATLDSIANAGILLDGAGNNNLTINNTVTGVTLTNNTSFLVNNGGVLSVAAPLNLNGKTLTLGSTLSSGSGSIVISGLVSSAGGAITVNDTAGTTSVTLSSSNTYTGATTLTAGTLIATSNAGALGAGSLSLGGGVLDLTNASGTNLSFGRNTTVTGNTQITSDVTAASTAGNTYTLGTLSIGAQTLTVAGGSNVNSGTAGVTFGAATITGSSVFNITNPANGGTTLLTVAAVTGGTNSVTLKGAGNFAATGIWAGTATSSLILDSTFSGTATLSGANTFTGGVAINGGTVVATVAGGLGATSAKVAFGGGTLDLRAAATSFTSGINTSNGGGTILVEPAASGTGAVTQTLTLANTLGTNTIVMSAGGNTLANTNYGLTLSGANSFNAAGANATFTINGNGSGNGTLTLSGGFNTGGNFETLTFNTGTGSGTNSAVISGAFAGTSGTLALAGNAPVTINALTTTGNAVQINGSGTYTFAGASSFTGGVILNNSAATVIATAANGLGSTSGKVKFGVAGTTLDLRGATTTFTSGIDSSTNGGTITVEPAASGTGAVTHTMSLANTLGTNTVVMSAGANALTNIAYGLTLSGANAFSAPGTNATFTINGNGSGNGTLTLSGGFNNNGNTNTLTLNSGTGSGVNSAVISGAFTGTPGTLVLAGNAPVTLNALTGATADAVQLAGTATYTLTGASTYSGGLTIKSGTAIANVSNSGTTSGAAGTGAITLGATGGSTAATLLANSFTVSNAINLGTTSGALTIGNNGLASAAVFSGAIGLNGNNLNISSTGTGTTGSTTISGGISGAGNIFINNGSVAATTTISANAINNSGTIFNSGTGTGLTTISGGVGSNVAAITESSTSSALTVSTTALTVNSGSTVLNNNNTGGSSLLTVSGGVNGTGNLVLNNNSSIANGITISTTALNNTGGVINSGTGSGSVTISSVIGANVTNVTQNSGSSPLILSAANLFTGPLNIQQGLVQLGNTTAAGLGTVTFGTPTTSGTLDLNGASRNIFGLAMGSGANGGVIGNGGTTAATLNYLGASGSFNGVIQNVIGSGTSTTAVIVNSVGANLVLAGANTYTAGTTISAGTLGTALSSNGTPFGTGAITISSGTLNFAPAGSGSDITYTANGGLFTYGAAMVGVNKGSQTSLTVNLSSATVARSGKGLLIINAGHTGDLGIGAGGENLKVGGTAPAVASNMVSPTFVGLGVTTAGMGDFLTYGANGFASAAGSYTNHAASFTTVNNEIANVTADATITNGIAGQRAYALLVQNGVTATLNGTVILGGGTATAQAGLILNGGTLSGGTLVFGNGTAEGIIYGFNGSSTISSQINGSGGFTIGGNQTISLTSYGNLNSGAITITSGGLNLLGTINPVAAVTVAGGSLNLGNANLISQGTLTVGSYVTSNLTESAANAITGNAALTINSGTSTLSTANNYTGATTVGAGTLTLTGAGAINGSAVTVNNGASILNVNAANAIAGNSSLAVTNGVVNITQAQNYTGPTSFSGGVINISGSGNLSSNISLSGATLNLQTAGAITGGTLNMVSGSIVETVDNAITGSTSVLFQQGGSLSRANNYTGATIVYGGANSATFNGNTVCGTVLDFSQSLSPVSNIINNGISHANIGTGSTLTLNGGQFFVIGKNGVANSQEFNGLTVGAGVGAVTSIAGTSGSMSLVLNAITRNAGGTLVIGGGGTTTTTTSNANFAGGQATILGGWALAGSVSSVATVSASSWAVSAASGGNAGAITSLALGSYTANTGNVLPTNGGNGADIDMSVAGGANVTTDQTINSLRFNNPLAQTITISSGKTLTIATGGILNTGSVAAFTSTITGGSITSGNGTDLIINQFNTTGTFAINSNIVNNGTNSIGVTVGTGNGSTTVLGGTNTFTGPLTIAQGTLKLGSSHALDGNPNLVMTFLGVAAGTFDLNGFNATISGISDTLSTVRIGGGINGGLIITNGAVATTGTLTINNNTNNVFDGGIRDGAGILALTKSGTGMLTLSASVFNNNDQVNAQYSGATTINGGKLYLKSSSIALTKTISVTVNNGASIGAAFGASATPTVGNYTSGSFTGVTIAGGGAIDQVDGTAGQTFKIAAPIGATSLTIGDASAAGILNLEVGSAGSDNISVTGTNTNTSGVMSIGAKGITINLVGVGGTPVAAPLLSGSSFAGGSSISTFVGNVNVANGINLGTTSGNFNGNTIALVASGSTTVSTTVTANVTPNTAYFSGNSGTAAGGGNLWNSFSGGNANNSNWVTTDGGSTDTNQQPGAATDVFFGTAPTGTNALANYLNNAIAANTTISSLNFNSTAGTSAITIGGNFNLTISNGITDSATGGTQTISTQLLTLGSGFNTPESITVTSSADTLAITSNIVDAANNSGIILTGSGTLALTGVNTYGGATTISGGVLSTNLLANGGVASGIGGSSKAATNLVLDGGALRYTGGAASTDRLFSVSTNGGSLDASGGGAVNFTNTGTMGFAATSGTRSLTLTGTNTGANTIAAVIADNGGATSLNKNGTGRWVLTGASTFTGNTTITAGTLALGSTGSIANSSKIIVGDTSANSGAKFDVSALSGGFHVVNGQTLAGHGTVVGSVTVDSGAHLAPGNSVGTLTVGALTLSGGSILDYEFNGNPANDMAVVSASGGLTINGGGINLYAEGGTSAWTTIGTYNLIGYTGALNGTGVAALSVLNQQSGYTYNFGTTTISGTNYVTLSIATTGTGTTSTTYTLTASADSTNILTGGTTGITSVIHNTGSGSADTLNYAGLGAGSATGGSVGGSTTSGTGLAQGASGTNAGQIFTGTQSGAIVVTPTGSGTNGTLGTTATATGTTSVTVNVFDPASLSGAQSGTGAVVAVTALNQSGTFRAAAKVTADNGLSNNQGFINVAVTPGTQINSGSSVTVASFDKTNRLNGTYTATKGLVYDNVTSSGSAITGGTGNTANVGLSVTVSGQTAGAGQTFNATLFSGQKYGTTTGSTSSGYGLTSGIAGDSHSPTTATLINGTASANTTVSMSFNTVPSAGAIHDTAFRTSDILSLGGIVATGTLGPDHSILTDKYVLQMSYDPSAVGAQYIGWYDADQSQWVNAIAGNSTGAGLYDGTGEFAGSYAAYLATLTGPQQADLAFQLNAFGYDSSTHTAWAVLNHNSEFAVIPEPSTWGMILSGFGMLIGIQRLRRRRVGT